jgi:enoyl-CoA hydratase/carnithine racemase
MAMPVEFTVDDGVAIITMNRPERMNALDAEAYQQLSQAWEQVRDDTAIRAAIITGAGGKAFTTGADLKSFVGKQRDLSTFWQTQTGQLLNRGLEIWKPVIAAVDVYCLGGGMTLLLATDIRIATPTATFGLAEVTRGVVAGNGGTQRVLEQLPYPIAMEMLLTGARIDAEQAARWGLINRVVPAEQLMDSAMSAARVIAANAPLAVQAAKELALRSRDVDRATGLRLEQTMNQVLQYTEDAQEGPAAFAEKRPARFTGR